MVKRGSEVWYFHGSAPMFTHPAEDRASIRAFTSHLCDMGLCKQADVVRTFKMPKKNVIRAVADALEADPALLEKVRAKSR